MRVAVWNRGCEDLWGLRADEATGAPLTSLDIGLPMDSVLPLIGTAFVDPDSVGETVVDVVNRRGRSIRLRVTCSSFRTVESGVHGAMLMMEVLA
jgi:two-component system CheB/CheR fusion protein